MKFFIRSKNNICCALIRRNFYNIHIRIYMNKCIPETECRSMITDRRFGEVTLQNFPYNRRQSYAAVPNCTIKIQQFRRLTQKKTQSKLLLQQKATQKRKKVLCKSFSKNGKARKRSGEECACALLKKFQTVCYISIKWYEVE